MRLFGIFIIMALLSWPVSLSSNTIRPGQPDSAPQTAPSGEAGKPGQNGAQGSSPQQGDQASPPSAAGGGDDKDKAASNAPSSTDEDKGPGNAAKGDDATEPKEQQAGATQPETPGADQNVGASAPEKPKDDQNAGAGVQETPKPQASGGASPAPTPKEDQEKLMSIAAVGKPRSDISGQPLVIPENTNDVSFLEGNWSFDKEFETSKGDSMRADFVFDGKGKGKTVLSDSKGNNYVANTEAVVENGTLRLHTGNFVSETSPEVFNSEFIECVNGANGAECAGTDGFGMWTGERVYSSKINVAETVIPNVNLEPINLTPQNLSTRGPGRGNNPPTQNAGDANGGKANVNLSPKPKDLSGRGSDVVIDSLPPQVTCVDGAAGPSGKENYVELAAEGAELAPVIMEKAPKATAGKNGASLSSLEGDWRFSQDLARKSDGAGVGLEFHFDKKGKGYSVIKDGSSKEYRATAQSMVMPNGTIRVKTDAYQNGGNRAYYPTFMECSGKAASELQCNVSNGWMRVENGRLVSLKSYEENVGRVEMEELLTTVESGKGGKEGPSTEIVDILTGFTPPPTSPEAPRPKGVTKPIIERAPAPKQPTTLVLPPKGSSVSFIQGKWLCQTGLVNAATNQPIVVEFTFDRNGKGAGTVVERSGKTYRSSAQATYRNGTLRINTSEYYATRGNGAYQRTAIECHERKGSAQCYGRNRDGDRWDAVFVRKQ